MNFQVRMSAASKFARIISALIVCVASLAGAQIPGTFDTTFGTSGTTLTQIGSSAEGWRTVALQPDGKIVTSTACTSGSVKAFCLARFSATGALDNTFGTSGKTITTIGSADATATGIAILADGKIVLGGHCGTSGNAVFCLARYMPNGTLDANFGSSGVYVTPNVSGVSNVVSVGVAAYGDGRLVIGGTCGTGNTRYCVGRYLAGGTLDTSFASVGIATTILGTAAATAGAIVLQPDGYPVLGGSCSPASYFGAFAFCFVRYAPNGTTDSGFGSSGIYFAPKLGNSTAEPLAAMALQPNGSLVAGGLCLSPSGGGSDFCLTRVTNVGTVDTRFGANGVLVSPISAGSGPDTLTALYIQNDGHILASGNCYISGSFGESCLARYNPDGSLDATFGTGGKVIVPIGTVNDTANAIAVQADGKIVVAGQGFDGLSTGFYVARFHGGPLGYRNCSLDIDGDGRVLATSDALIHARLALGMSGSAVTNGIAFPATATRQSWADIRSYLLTQCGLSLP